MNSKHLILLSLSLLLLLSAFSCGKKTTEPGLVTVSTPFFDPPGGTYTSNQNVSISCATLGVTILYTIDGTEPHEGSPVYSDPIPISEDNTIKAKAIRNGFKDSKTAIASYTIMGTVATPTFSLAGATYYSAQEISLSCTTSGATIHFTTDGSEPTTSSTIYSSPINVSSTTTIKAKAFMSGRTPSSTASASYAIIVAVPTFSLAGGNYTSAQSVSIACATPGATIRYTTNGNEPNTSSAVYNGAINVNRNTTLKAKAFKEGWPASNTASTIYLFYIFTPTFSPAGGNYTSAQNVSITCATPGTTIRYTTNGSKPNANSAVYNSAINVNANMMLRAKAFKDGWLDSVIASTSYSFKVSSPTFSPAGGNYTSAQSVSITCATPGATIRYTSDGSEPSISSAVYNSPINVNANTTLKAKAFKAGWANSVTASASYSFKVSTPTFSPAGGNYNSTQIVSITCTTPGATIRYTTNGSEPNISSAVYKSPINVNSLTVFKAKAFKDGWTQSNTAKASFTFLQMQYVPGGSFTMGRTKGSGTMDELPTHTVSLNPFYMSKYQITQAEYVQYLEPECIWTQPFGLGDDYPAYNVSWFAALKFCNLLSMAEGLTAVYSISGSTNPAYWDDSYAAWDAVICDWKANGYRLPTEAEWEYAARGATNNPDYLYSGSDDINAVAWYNGNSVYKTHPVGSKAANGIGIYDMSGNVREWCWDRYDIHYYESSPQDNPKGPKSGKARVTRGGSWEADDNGCRVASRYCGFPGYSNYDNGLRLVRAIQ